jgi:hypothetical protein
MEQLSIFSQEDFPASHSPVLGSAKGGTITDSFGRKCLELLVRRAPDGSLVRMFLDYLVSRPEWYSSKCALTWNVKVTKSGRSVFQLAASTRRTNGNGYGYAPVSDDAMDREKGKINSRGEPKLSGQIAMLRTPASRDPGIKTNRLATKDGAPAQIGQRAYDKDTGRLAQVGLTQQIAMLRTPTVAMLNADRAKDASYAHRKMDKGQTITLADQIAMLPTPQTQGLKTCDENGKTQYFKMTMLPTPAVRDCRGANGPDHMAGDRPHMDQLPNVITHGTNRGLRLHPDFVEWMQGYPIGWTDLNPSETA